ncbi:ABC transporter permease [Sphingoaurantiacus capsulatus]|uniref:ABC transporter permease n=1 Tax=Sphingoaurantiacus capsulatus TaxID=1771310 RepID=A0ABV7XA86_9SPHN
MAVAPLIGVVMAALAEGSAAIAARDVARYAATSALLALIVGATTAVAGTIAAWLVVMHEFPGRRWFAWALALPLAAPAFVLAYAYASLFDVGGPLRFALRDGFGFDLPIEMHNMAGAAFVFTCAFYPYVYLAMRAAFLAQPLDALEAARTLGASPMSSFRAVALPVARPALAAGVALAVMETLADYGAAQFLSVQTLTTGVVRAWSVYGSTASAARFALPLLAAAALLLWVERAARRGRSHQGGRARWRPLPRHCLTGLKAAAATGFCALLLTAGLLLPVGWMLWNAIDITPEVDRLIRAGLHSLLLGGIAAVVTVGLATALAIGARNWPAAVRVASLGYATPGAAMALGLLVPAALLWRHTPAGSSLVAGIALLVYAYAARLMAAALEPIDAGLQRVSPAMIDAARTLGRGEMATAAAVQVPVARGAMLTAMLIIFIDVLKELPATLILRPFNFETLAVMASNYALDERLAQAGWPSLAILALSLPAVMWLTRRIALSRPGHVAQPA